MRKVYVSEVLFALWSQGMIINNSVKRDLLIVHWLYSREAKSLGAAGGSPTTTFMGLTGVILHGSASTLILWCCPVSKAPRVPQSSIFWSYLVMMMSCRRCDLPVPEMQVTTPCRPTPPRLKPRACGETPIKERHSDHRTKNPGAQGTR